MYSYGRRERVGAEAKREERRTTLKARRKSSSVVVDLEEGKKVR